MRERPILLSAPMVRAILEGRKTQTRLVMKPQPEDKGNGVFLWDGEWACGSGDRPGIFGKYVPGDRLWVRETFWHQPEQHDSYPGMGSLKVCDEVTVYRADVDNDEDRNFGWRPSIFMPRALSRITLEITDVRVQRVQEISHRDSVAEGVGESPFAETAFARLWDSINAKKYPWASNPWVWAITFRRIDLPA